MEELLKLTTKQVDTMTLEMKKWYYEQIKEYCLNLKEEGKKSKITSFLKVLYPYLRSFNIDIYGEHNIPENEPVIFLINHSNSHDFFVMLETMQFINRDIVTLAAKDSLNSFSQKFFELNNSIMIDRGNRKESQEGLWKVSKKIMNGDNGIVFGEGTWNLHPIKPMLNIKNGVTKLAAYTNALIIPTIFEYLEVPNIVDKEKELYRGCMVSFGKPIQVDYTKGIIEETRRIQHIMEENRRKSWEKFGIRKNSLEDIDKYIYINHTYLKKFGGLGFTFDSEYEMPFIYFNYGEPHENEYHLTKLKKFEPGIILKTDQYKRF